MLAKGCFAVCFTHPPDARGPSPDSTLERMRSFCDADETVHALASPDGRCLVGSIAGEGQQRWLALKADHERGTAGAFDGWCYTPSLLVSQPERMGEEDLDMRRHGNGMFTAVAYRGGTRESPSISPSLYFTTDAFGTTPLYYGEADGIFATASSLPLLASLLGKHERNSNAMAELLYFTEILTDATPLHGIRRAEPGSMYRWDPRSRVLTTRRWWNPSFGDETPKSENAIGDAVESFARAVRRTASAAREHGDPPAIHAALTGGLDSRTVWAVLLHDRAEAHDDPHSAAQAVVHAAADDGGEGLGGDLRIARAIARRHDITLREVLLGADFLREAAADLPRFLRASNGLCSGDLLHLPYLYRRHAEQTRCIVDAVNTYSERRHGLRRLAAGAASHEALVDAVWNAYFKPGLPALLSPRDRSLAIESVRAGLATVVPDPKEHASPVAAVEALYLTRLIGRHGNDASAVQNHVVRYMTPYFDLEYVDALLLVPESRRSAERVQDAILRRFAPALRSVPRSYADVRTLPVAWRPLQLLPVALQRHAIDRLPRGLRARLDLRRGGSRYAEWFSGPMTPLFEAVRRNPAPFETGAVEAFLRGLAAGEHGDTHAAGFLLGQFSEPALF